MTDTHSCRILKITQPKAIVTMARYGPRTRNAGNASNAPKPAATQVPSTMPSQMCSPVAAKNGIGASALLRMAVV